MRVVTNPHVRRVLARRREIVSRLVRGGRADSVALVLGALGASTRHRAVLDLVDRALVHVGLVCADAEVVANARSFHAGEVVGARQRDGWRRRHDRRIQHTVLIVVVTEDVRAVARLNLFGRFAAPTGSGPRRPLHVLVAEAVRDEPGRV